MLLLAIACSDISESDFDAIEWQSQKGNLEQINPRASMIGALEKYHIRIGMRREQIRKLLGEPDSIVDQIDVYDIGVSPFGVDLETFQETYQEGSVSDFRITRN